MSPESIGLPRQEQDRGEGRERERERESRAGGGRGGSGNNQDVQNPEGGRGARQRHGVRWCGRCCGGVHWSYIHTHGFMLPLNKHALSRSLRRSGIVLGKHSGRNALNSRLRTLGYELSQSELDDVFK